jgi:hypothetical protein
MYGHEDEGALLYNVLASIDEMHFLFFLGYTEGLRIFILRSRTRRLIKKKQWRNA